MSDEAVRKEFEAWYVKEFDRAPDAWFAAQNRYYHGHTQQRWATWQASRSAAIQECADKLKELSEDDNIPSDRWIGFDVGRDAILALKER